LDLQKVGGGVDRFPALEGTRGGRKIKGRRRPKKRLAPGKGSEVGKTVTKV